MKKFVFFLFFIIWYFPSLAFQTIDGYWENERAAVTILVESTGDGIRVNRIGQSIWYTYTQLRNNFYRDQEGNTYFLIANEILEWESGDGRKKLRFQKVSAPGRHADPHARSNQAYERYPTEGTLSIRDLEGHWINRTSRQVIVIDARRQDLFVKPRHRVWRAYSLIGKNTWRDRYGNQYKVRNSKLFFVNNTGDLIMRFERIVL